MARIDPLRKFQFCLDIDAINVAGQLQQGRPSVERKAQVSARPIAEVSMTVATSAKAGIGFQEVDMFCPRNEQSCSFLALDSRR